MRPLALTIVATASPSYLRGSAPAAACTSVAPAAYRLEVPAGTARLPARLDLICLPGQRVWGRLLVVTGRDTITGALRFTARAADTLRFGAPTGRISGGREPSGTGASSRATAGRWSTYRTMAGF